MNIFNHSMICFISLLLSSLTILSNVYGYSCYRYIKNQSNKPWIFKNSPPQSGNLHFLMNCPNAENGPCAIPPKTTVKIQYTDFLRGEILGNISITDYTNETRTFRFENYGYHTCPHIKHKGKTGGVALNDPADGDYNIWKDSW